MSGLKNDFFLIVLSVCCLDPNYPIVTDNILMRRASFYIALSHRKY